MLYLIYDYEEHGPTNLVATTNKDKIAKAIDKHFNLMYPDGMHEWAARRYAEVPERLASLKDDLETPGEYSIVDGWGGTVLEVVELED